MADFTTRCAAKRFRIWQANRHLTEFFERPATIREIAEFTGYKPCTVNYWLGALGTRTPERRKRIYDADRRNEHTPGLVSDLVSIFERNVDLGYPGT